MQRQQPNIQVRRNLANFYGGLGCVVTAHPEGRASLHHLDGNPSRSDFGNLLPLALDLHNGLRLGLAPDDLRKELREKPLKKVAENHFRSGDAPRAFGCLRLAYAISAHFQKGFCRDLDAEFQLLAHCLYFLRRCVGQAKLELVYENLRWLLEAELQRTLSSKKVIPPFGSFCLLAELGSWLNELGHSRFGLQLLKTGRDRLRRFQTQLSPSEMSRFLRQMSAAFVQIGQHGAELEKTLQFSADCGDATENNRFANFNLRLSLHLGKQDPKKAFTVLKERFDYFERETDYFFGPLTGMDPTIMTSLGYIALSLICESQLIRTSQQSKKLNDRLEALKLQEKRYERATMLNQVPGMDLAVARAAANVPETTKLLENNQLPTMPDSLAELILRTASQL